MVSKSQTEKILEETKMLVKLFLETNASDIELEKTTGISSSTIGRRLTNKERIMTVFPNEGEKIYTEIVTKRKNNLQRGKVLGGQTSMLNNATIKDKISNTKLRLDLFYDNKDKQIQFLLHLILTFRLSLTSVSELFQIDEKELLEKLVLISGNAYSSLLYLIYHDKTEQKEAKESVVIYYRDLLNAMRMKDKDTLEYLMNQVTDVLASKIIISRKLVEELSDEEIEIILKYQLKYAISDNDLAKTFNISSGDYKIRLDKLFKEKNELLEKYNILINNLSKRSGIHA